MTYKKESKKRREDFEDDFERDGSIESWGTDMVSRIEDEHSRRVELIRRDGVVKLGMIAGVVLLEGVIYCAASYLFL